MIDTRSIDVSGFVRERLNDTDVHTFMQERAVYDIIKDSLIPPRIGSSCIRESLRRLFPRVDANFPSYANKLAEIKQAIQRNRTYVRQNDRPISFLKVSRGRTNLLEDGSIRLTTDSGISAKSIQRDCTEYRTFASTIDRAKRNKDTFFFPKEGEAITISKTILHDILGFPIEALTSKLEGNVCTIQITLQDGRVITIQRNKHTEKHVGSSVDYCIGNIKKNQAILSLCRHDPRNEIDIYLLVKELGDVMQVVLAFIMKKYMPSDSIDVVGTLDDVVRSLCDFFKVNCMYQGRKEIEEGKHVVWYRKFEEDPEKAKQSTNRLVQRNILIHNGHVMMCIRNAIDENSLYMGDKNYLRNLTFVRNKPLLVGFLESIIDAINRIQTTIEAMDTNLAPEEFAKLVYQYQATKIVTEKFKVNQAAYRLFPKGLAEAEDRIFQQGRRLSDILQYPNRIQGGGRGREGRGREGRGRERQHGGESNAPLPEDYHLAENGEEIEESEEITHAFLRNVQTCMPDGFLTIHERHERHEKHERHERDTILYVTPHDVLYILYAGLSYIGETPLNPNVLQQLIARYVIHTEGYDLREFKMFVHSIVVPLHPNTLIPYSALDPDRAQTEEQFTHILPAENMRPKTRPNNVKNYNASRKGKLASLYARPPGAEPNELFLTKRYTRSSKHRNI